MRIWAWAPGTTTTSRVAAMGVGAGTAGISTFPGAMVPKIRWTWATTSALFTSPLTARTIWPGT